jgi:hypothetical protein
LAGTLGGAGPCRIERPNCEFSPRQGAPFISINRRQLPYDVGESNREFIGALRGWKTQGFLHAQEQFCFLLGRRLRISLIVSGDFRRS